LRCEINALSRVSPSVLAITYQWLSRLGGRFVSRPIPVYEYGKLVSQVIGGKLVPLVPAPPVERIPVGQRRLRYRDREYEAGVTCYFIGGETGPIKIGFTDDLPRRLREIQSHSPVKLTVLASVGGGIFAELEYHERFAAHRLHGEWFERHPDIVAEIERITP
jgi:Meiotically up-regulated gene 113